MGNRGTFHSKKISVATIGRPRADDAVWSMTRRMAKKTQLIENYCDAPSIFAETSRFSPVI
jgi:hypothetical protein